MLPSVRYLVDAVARAQPPLAMPSFKPKAKVRRSFDQRMEWATDLYARLEQQDRRALR